MASQCPSIRKYINSDPELALDVFAQLKAEGRPVRPLDVAHRMQAINMRCALPPPPRCAKSESRA